MISTKADFGERAGVLWGFDTEGAIAWAPWVVILVQKLRNKECVVIAGRIFL